MGERVPVEVGQVRRSTKGGLVRVLGFGMNRLENAVLGANAPEIAVRQLDTGKVLYPSRQTVELWPVIDGKGE